MKKILSILIAMTLMISLFSGVAFAGSSSSGGMIIMRKTEEPAKEPEAEEATPAEATPAEPEAEETTPAEATPVEPEETTEEATAEEPAELEPAEEEAVEEETEETVEEATSEEAPVEEVTSEEATPEQPLENPVIPDDAMLMSRVYDALDADRSLTIYASWGGGDLYYGDIINMFVEVLGYEDVIYTLNWQYSVDGSSWQNIDGATGTTYSFQITEENGNYSYRVIINIDGVAVNPAVETEEEAAEEVVEEAAPAEPVETVEPAETEQPVEAADAPAAEQPAEETEGAQE